MKPLTPTPVYALRADASAMDLARPSPAEVDFRQIAGQLSRVSRFNGLPFNGAYSVAQHAVLGADAMLREGAGELLAGLFLLQSAHIAFLGDITVPTKELIEESLASRHGTEAATRYSEVLADIRAGWESVIYERAGLPAPAAWKRSWFTLVDTMQQRMTLTEARELLGEQAAKWPGFRRNLTRPPISGTIKPWPAAKAEFAFLEMLEKLVGRDRVAGSVRLERSYREFGEPAPRGDSPLKPLVDRMKQAREGRR